MPASVIRLGRGEPNHGVRLAGETRQNGAEIT